MVGVGVGATLALIAAEAWQRSLAKEIADQKPARLQKVDPRSIKADPETFQFKSGGDAHGVTDRLKGVTQWDPVAAGKTVVWERADGERFIADGHQRRGLALRSIEAGQKNVRLDAYVMREREGWKPRDVRAYAALKNMKESSGNALDMAKVVRERPDLINGSVPLSDTKVKEAVHLARLSQPAFDMVANGIVKPEIAAAVGEAVKEPSSHAGLLADMKSAEVASAQHARLYVAQSLAAPAITETTGSLFGEETQTRSLLKERAQVLDRALTALKSDKKLFGLLEREAANIEAVGNRLAHDTNIAKAEGAGRTAALVEKLSTTRGPVSAMLDEAAKTVAAGETPAKAARQFVSGVGGALKAGGMAGLLGDASTVMKTEPTEHQVAAAAGQRSMLDEPSNHLRGTQNPENLKAIAANRKAKPMARKSEMASGEARATKRQTRTAKTVQDIAKRGGSSMDYDIAAINDAKSRRQAKLPAKTSMDYDIDQINARRDARAVPASAPKATAVAPPKPAKASPAQVRSAPTIPVQNAVRRRQAAAATPPKASPALPASAAETPRPNALIRGGNHLLGKVRDSYRPDPPPAEAGRLYRGVHKAADVFERHVAYAPTNAVRGTVGLAMKGAGHAAAVANTIPRPSYGSVNTALGASGVAVAAASGYRKAREEGSGVAGAAFRGIKDAAVPATVAFGRPAGEMLGHVGRGMTSFAGEMLNGVSSERALLATGAAALDMPGLSAVIAPEIYLGMGAGAMGWAARGAGAILRGVGHVAAPAIGIMGGVEGSKEDANRARGFVRGAVRALDPTGIFMHRGLAERAVDRVAGGPQHLGSDHANKQFAEANERYKLMHQASHETDPGKKRVGYGNAARIGAYKARMAKAGKPAENAPYGGDAGSSQGRAQGPL